MNDMKRIITCHCGKKEYLGMMTWRDRQLHCRYCIEEIWGKDGTDFKFEYHFPLYEDGKDYTTKYLKNERRGK